MVEIGTIKAVHIHVHRRLYITAELELNLKGVNYRFGGPGAFVSGMYGGESCDAPFIGRFLFRCMQVCNVDTWELLKSSKVRVEINDGKVTAIADTAGKNWFNPAREFEIMERERQQSELALKDDSNHPGNQH